MAHIVEVPGHGEVEFPDSMSNEDITAAIKKIIAPPVAGMEKLGAMPSVGNPLKDGRRLPMDPEPDDFWTSPNGLIRTGGRQVAAGLAAMTRPTADEKMGALSTMVRGAGTMATPAMIPAMAGNPIKGASSLLAGFTGGKAAKGAASLIGAGEGGQNLAEDIGNLIAGGYAYSKAPAGVEPIVNAGSDAKAAMAGFANPKPKLAQTSGTSGLGNLSPFELRHAASHPTTGVPLALAHAFTKGRWSGAADAVRANRIQRMPIEQPLAGHEFAPEAEPRVGKPLRPPLSAPPADIEPTRSLMENFTEPASPEEVQAYLAANRAARQQANPRSATSIIERLKAPKTEEAPAAPVVAGATEKGFEYPDYADLYKDSAGKHHPAAPSAFKVDKDVIMRAEELGLTPDALAKGSPAQFEQLYKDTNHPKSFKSLIENGDRLQMLLKTWRRFRGEE